LAAIYATTDPLFLPRLSNEDAFFKINSCGKQDKRETETENRKRKIRSRRRRKKRKMRRMRRARHR
jgi:hypothetical protein